MVMDKELQQRLLASLRAQCMDIGLALRQLDPTVEFTTAESFADGLSMASRAQYRMIRMLRHLEMTMSEDYPFFPTLTDLSGVCRDTAQQVDGITQTLGVSFRWSLDRDCVPGMADGPLLSIAVMNLLSNAFAAAGRGGRVSLRAYPEGERFFIVVSDDGEGLTDSAGESPFLKKGNGLGLGLAAARKAAKLHEGVIMLEDTGGSGVRAVMSIPIQKGEACLGENKMPFDHSGGFSNLLVEFSEQLPIEEYRPERLD